MINGFMLFFFMKVCKIYVIFCYEIIFCLDVYNVVVFCGYLVQICYNWLEDYDVSLCKYGVYILNVYVIIDGMGK